MAGWAFGLAIFALYWCFDLSRKNQKLVDELEKHRLAIRSLQRGETVTDWTRF